MRQPAIRVNAWWEATNEEKENENRRGIAHLEMRTGRSVAIA
jgi:hypothetical protein